MRLIHVLLVPAIVCSVSAQAPVPSDARAAETLVAARSALGGPRLDAVTALSISGAFRRLLGEREMEGDLEVDLAVPDRIRRTEHTGFPGGPSFSRTMGLDGTTFWSDATNRGGFMRMGGPGGEPTEADRERMRARQQRQLQRERDRYLLALLLRTPAEVRHTGIAEADDGSADVIEVGARETGPMRLFIDRETHLPLMLSYRDVVPRMRIPGGPGGPGRRPDREELRRLVQEPPREATMELRFDDYREVDGVKLPHRITRSVDGDPVEEWTIDRYTINPRFKPNAFQKP